MLATALVVGLVWLLTSRAATPDAYPGRGWGAPPGPARRRGKALPVTPCCPTERGRPACLLQLRTAAAVAPLLRALRQPRPVIVDKQTF
ncbi:MAG: hypothetical protein WKG07_43430 [Hymenobacter sp.]